MPEVFNGKKEIVNGITIYYEEYSPNYTRPSIILLHGFLSSSYSFRKLAPLLAEDFHVIAVDLPPFGKSGKDKGFYYSYSNMAKTVIGLIEKLGLGQVQVAGHSMGGQIALNMMHQQPGLVQKGVLLSSSSYYSRAKKLHIAASYLPFFSRYVKYYLSKTGVTGNLKIVVHNQSMIDEEMIRGYAEQFEDDRIFAALVRMLRQREGDLPAKVLRTIQTPCLLIWGENDRIVKPRIGRQLVNDLPNSELIVLKNTGHLVPEERPQETAELMRNFFNSKRPNKNS